MTTEKKYTVHNTLTQVESSADSLTLKGKIQTDSGLITQAEAIVSNEDHELYFIFPTHLDIDFEHDDDNYVFDYHLKIQLDSLAEALFKARASSCIFQIQLRISLKDQKRPLMTRLKANPQSNQDFFNDMAVRKHGLSQMFFSLNADEQGYLGLNSHVFDKNDAQYLVERTTILKRAQPFSLNKNIWLLGGYSPQKRSYNSWQFFKFLQEEHPEIDSYYILDEEADEFQSVHQSYGDRMLIYGSRQHIQLLLRASILLTSGSFQSFYPIPSPAYHHHVKARKVWMPASLVAWDSQPYSFHFKRGLSPADYVVCLSETEADFIHLHMAYPAQQLLITGRPLAERFNAANERIQEENVVFFLADLARRTDEEKDQIIQHYKKLCQQKTFQHWLESKDYKAVLALELKDLEHYAKDLQKLNLSLVLASADNVISYMKEAALVISNDHPLASTFLLKPGDLYLLSQQAPPSPLPTEVHLCHNGDDLVEELIHPVRVGKIDPDNSSYLAFNDQLAKERLFGILVDQL